MRILILALLACAAWGQVSSIVEDNISHSSARVSFLITPNTPTVIRYGTTSGGPYTLRTPYWGSAGTAIHALTGMSCGVQWFYQIYDTKATQSEGDDTTLGSEGDLTTSACPGGQATHRVTPTLPTDNGITVPPTSFTNTYNVASNCSDLASIIVTARAQDGNQNHRVVTPANTNCNATRWDLGAKTGSNPNGTGYIVIGPAFANLPPPGGMLDKTRAALYSQHMTTLQSTVGTNNVVLPAATAKGYWLVGVIIRWDSGVATAANVALSANGASNIVCDRCWILGGVATASGFRATKMNGTDLALINSFVQADGTASFHGIAFSSDNGTNLKVENNHLWGAGINSFLTNDAASAHSTNLIYRRNLVEGPEEHRNGSAVSDGIRHIHRQPFEIKQGCQVLIEGNRFFNWWADEQVVGNVFLFTPRPTSTGQTDPGCVLDDVTIRGNWLKKVAGFMEWEGVTPDVTTELAAPSKRLLVDNNLVQGMDGTFTCTGCGTQARGHGIRAGSSEDVWIKNNTIMQADGSGGSTVATPIWFPTGGAIEGLVVENNDFILANAATRYSGNTSLIFPDGVTDPSTLTHKTRLDGFAKPSYVWTNNLHPAGANQTTAGLEPNMPSGNHWPGDGGAGITALGLEGGTPSLTSTRPQDYCLSVFSSNYRSSGNDGRTVGIRCAAILESLGGTYGESVQSLGTTTAGGGFNAPANGSVALKVCASSDSFATQTCVDTTPNASIPWYHNWAFTGLTTGTNYTYIAWPKGPPYQGTFRTR